MMITNFKKAFAVSLAALTMTAAVAATSTPAAAANGRHAAFAAGLLGGLTVGAIAAGGVAPYYSAGPYYDDECWIDSRPVYNHWGDFVGYRRVRVCN